ncbi:hypothetical protein Poli38472_003411 [Pythium oligandrum]|uniref:Uncharacterized protein n=1 Tax=Pythium oligandrum TaxID=41045 RepID=A0A8K1C6H0_PYTOL|nr:hypothetical protein Poli38472_003411 [Pythium oligandrum]|eukprot:TMW57486.1 hypothetical protein Poli38472_003411 [Pythium oligandrum]
MGANTSPLASDAMATALAKSKKRKTSDPPPPLTVVGSTATATQRPTIDLNASSSLERMGTALDVSQSLMDRSLLDPALDKPASLTLEDCRTQIQQLTTLMSALRTSDVDTVASQLQRVFAADLTVLSTLQTAAQRAVHSIQTRRATPGGSNQPASTTVDVDVDGDMVVEGEGDDHEEAAAQALTGLRQSSNGSPSAAAAAAAAVAAVGIPEGLASPAPERPRSVSAPSTVFNPMMPMASPTSAIGGLTGMSPRHSMPMFAPHPVRPADLPPFSQSMSMFAPSRSPTHVAPAASPSALPSIFARGVLTPIATPFEQAKQQQAMPAEYATTPFATTPMVNAPLTTPNAPQQHMAPFIDWKSLATPQGQNAASLALSAPTMSPAAIVAAANALTASPSSAVPNLTPVTNLYRSTSQSSNGGASPMKRKSISTKQLVAAAVSSNPNITMPIAKSLAALERANPTRKANPRRWTKEEDDALRKAVENHKEKNWKAIAAQVPGRNHTQCLQRWTKVLAPGLVKGHWSPHEDELLRRLVAGGNKNWGEVAAKIPGRTSKQCRERWHNHLDPNIVRGAYTPEEDRIILEAQARLGNRWSVIAAMLPGRTEDAVKIRWKSHCRLWKARKYLRKTGSGQSEGSTGTNEAGADDDEDLQDDDGDVDVDADEIEVETAG